MPFLLAGSVCVLCTYLNLAFLPGVQRNDTAFCENMLQQALLKCLLYRYTLLVSPCFTMHVLCIHVE